MSGPGNRPGNRSGDTRRAVKAYEDFSGHKPKRVRRSRLDDRDVTGWQMGQLVGIAYEARRDGATKQYFHEFKKAARPELVARDDGRKLYIDGGRYKVTDRGIEDMPQLFVVNPSPRKPKRKTMARRATHRRRRATRQVAVFNTNPRRRRRRHTAVRRRSVRRHSFMTNPAPRRRRRRTMVRRFRRNPSARATAVHFGKLFLPAVGIGLGAVGSEIVMGYLPIPPSFKTGWMRHVTKGAVGVGAGLILAKVFKQKRLGNYFALGAVVIAVHDAAKELIAARAPGVHMGQYTRVPRSSFAGMGGMGFISPAQVAHGMGEYTGSPMRSFAGAGGGGETEAAI